MRQTYTGIRRFPERSIMICIIPDTSRHITLVINERRRENAILLPKPMHAAVSAPPAASSVMQEFKLKRAGCGTRHGRERRTTDLNTQLSVRILHPLKRQIIVLALPSCCTPRLYGGIAGRTKPAYSFSSINSHTSWCKCHRIFL